MKKTFVAIVCVLGLVLIVTNARAAITLTQFDGYYVGLIVDGIPASDALELGYIKRLITLDPGANTISIDTETYNRVGSTLTPLPPVNAYLGSGDAGVVSWNVVTDDPFYIYGKYDGPNYGALVWLVDASSGDVITLPSKAGYPGEKEYGLSHISVFSAVPIPSAIYLLGSGLVGLVGIGRWRRRK